jgi:transposase
MFRSTELGQAFRGFGHTVRLMAWKFVATYRNSGKNDDNDAAAICEVVSRPNMRFIPVKSPEQQALLMFHRVGKSLVEERLATINRIRGLLAEFGAVIGQRAPELRRCLVASLEGLPRAYHS